MSSSDEATFEAQIAGWLVERDGYRRVKVGTSEVSPTSIL